jgi:molecular chaperone DnaK
MLAHAQGQDRERIALVYDLGGGTFDVSAVRQDGPVLEVLASHGDSRLGGDDIDQALTDGVMTRLSRDQPELREQLDASAAARVRLRAAVEEAKIALSQTLHATLRAPFLADGPDGPLHLELELSRGELEEAAGPWIARTLESVDQVLQDAGLAPEDIDELLLVGGATQTPMVWAALRDRYGLEGSHAIPPRTAVALGAAIQGAIVDGSRVHGVLVDVAPYSLSVGVSTGPGPNISTHFLCRVLTPRNTPLPSRHTEIFATHHPLQDGVKVPIFQGGHPDPYRNTLLGMVEIMGLEPAPPGHFNRPIAVEFRHNLDGIISATVTEELSGRRGEARLALDGEASEALMEELEELIGDLETGDGSDPEEEEDAPPEVSAPADLSADAEEARRTFQAALGSADALAVEGLEALIREGLAALDAGDEAAALERYDALSDKLFDEGIFL